MPLIQCLLGQTTQTVAGQNYSFERDQFGRHVSVVHNADHAKVFLSVTHYQVVDDEAAPEQPKQADTSEPKDGAKQPRGRKKAEPKPDPIAVSQAPIAAAPVGATDPAAGIADAAAGAADAAAQTQQPSPAQDPAPEQPKQADTSEQE